MLGFSFGILQMVLYVMYKNAKKVILDQKLPEFNDEIIKIEEQKLPELKEQIIDVMKLSTMVSEIIPVVMKLNNNNCGREVVDEVHNVPANQIIEPVK